MFTSSSTRCDLEILAAKYNFSFDDNEKITNVSFLDAKLEKIDPPEYWKPLNYNRIYSDKRTIIKKMTKTESNSQKSCKRSCSGGCNYTTLIYKRTPERRSTGKAFRIFIDFEHDGLNHATWKELLEYDKLRMNDHLINKPLMTKMPRSTRINKQQVINNQYLQRKEIAQYFKSHIEKDNLFELDKAPYPNRLMPISRRPRDALHIDFNQAACFEGSKVEATFKTFFHRKYLVNPMKFPKTVTCLYLFSYLNIYMNIH